jgi:hypothetical protein
MRSGSGLPPAGGGGASAARRLSPRAQTLTLIAVRRFTTPKWLLTHAFVVVLVLLFAALGWWQLGRAVAGNTRSYAYMLEWPTFALLVIGFWIKIIYDDLHPKTGSETGDAAVAAPDAGQTVATGVEQPTAATAGVKAAGRAADDAELAAYNRYIAERARQRGQP